MARIPFILYVSGVTEVVPAIAYALSRQRTRPAAYLAAGAAVSALSDAVALTLAPVLGNNQVFSYITAPATLALFLAALAEWQDTTRARALSRMSIIPVILVWILLVAFVEDMRNFDLVTGPFFSLTLLCAGIWTLIRRAGVFKVTPLHQSDWFWATIGLAIQGACTALSSPLGAILIARDEFELFDIAWQLRSALVALSFILISWGIYRGPAVSKFSTVD